MEWPLRSNVVLRENDENGANNEPSMRRLEGADGGSVMKATFVFEVEPASARYVLAAVLRANTDYNPLALTQAARVEANARARTASIDQLMVRLDGCAFRVADLEMKFPSCFHFLRDQDLDDRTKTVLNLATWSVTLTHTDENVVFNDSDLEWLGKVAAHAHSRSLRTLSFRVMRTGLLKVKHPPREPFMGWMVNYSNTHRVNNQDVSALTLSAPNSHAERFNTLRKSPRLSPA
jgi:hypothetical protein